MSKTLITIPMKDPGASKTRLSDALDPKGRSRLVCLLYRRTLDVLGRVAHETGADLAVVTGSPIAAAIADERGVRVLSEPVGCDLTKAATFAARQAGAEGYNRFCVIHADLAAPDPDDLVTFLQSSAEMTLCPSADQGTNALLLSPPDAIGFHYGPKSAICHLQEAEARGLSTCLMPLDSLSFDIDTSACLSRAMQTAPDIARVCA